MKKISIIAQFGYAVYFALAAALVALSFITPVMRHYADTFIGVCVLCPAGYFLFRKAAGFLDKLGEKSGFLILWCLCVGIKLGWVVLFRILPETDYKMFFDTAISLSRSPVIQNRYVALFPHIMGYALFLSGFFKVFGVDYMLAPVLNVLLSVFSMGLIYYTCRLLLGRRTAYIACLLWIVFPSQTIYNMLTLSEPLYCTLLLAVWALIAYTYRNIAAISRTRLLLLSASLSLLLALFNMTRPLAVIQLAAFAGWLVFVDRAPLEAARRSKKLVCLAAVLVCYVVFGALGGRYVELRLGEEAASVPGYSLYVGLNAGSKGTWNETDAARLTNYNSRDGWTADRAQKQMYADTLEKVRNRQFALSQLIYEKYLIFLGDDSSAVYYAAPALGHTEALSTASNIFYFFLVVFSLAGAARALRANQSSPLFMICLYAVGLIMAQLLVEVAGRYHYSITLSFLFLAAYGLGGGGRKKKPAGDVQRA